MLYFAFGLNLIQRDMQLRIPRATPKGRAALPDLRTIFALHGYTTVIPVAGETTRGRSGIISTFRYGRTTPFSSQ
jgi:hypothetical protein